ncbi:MAG: hypothetical protein ACI93B_001103, partial [Yoonia sp.]
MGYHNTASCFGQEFRGDKMKNEIPAFVTGYGQSDTRALNLSDGKANPHQSAGQPYATLTGAHIAKLVKDPPSLPKNQAQ